MKDLPMELQQRVDEAGKDKQWAEKVRSAKSLEKFTELFKEKGIELPAQVKDALDASSTMNKAGKLEDTDLENVTGGWTNIFSCPQDYNYVLCELTRCPHRICIDNVPDENHYEMHCDQGFWTISRKYQHGAYAGHEQ